MDGLLVDSEPLWQESEKRVFANVGLHLTDAMCQETVGLRIDEVVDHWAQRCGFAKSVSKSQIVADIVDEMTLLFRTKAMLLPGVEEALYYYGSKSIPLGIASSSPLQMIFALVERFSFESVFQSVRSAEMEAYGKPHPAVYLSCCHHLGVAPTQTLAFEDSVNGVIAAKSAKMSVIAIPAAQDRDRPEFAIADGRYASLHDFLAALEVDHEILT